MFHVMTPLIEVCY